MPNLVDFVLHSDRHLLDFVTNYGTWVYALLFLIVFAETGFVVTPFLPGDSLLFATGALAATGALSAPTAFGLLATAAFAGNDNHRWASGAAKVFNAQTIAAFRTVCSIEST
jgi:membrane-associated protein